MSVSAAARAVKVAQDRDAIECGILTGTAPEATDLTASGPTCAGVGASVGCPRWPTRSA